MTDADFSSIDAAQPEASTALEQAASHAHICSKLAEQYKSDPVLFAALTDAAAILRDLMRGLGDWVLVPRVPTDAMLRAAQGAWLNDPLRRTTTMWAAMLAAAPQQPAVVDGAMVKRFLEALQNTPGDEAIDADEKVVRRWLAAALATQHQEPTT